MISVLWILFGVLFLVALSQPPSIVRHPSPLRIFRSEEQVDLDCEARGQPVLRYRWLKNGVPIDARGFHQPNVQFLAEGSVRILSASSMDEGRYICQVSNDLGTAVSNEARLLRAVLAPFVRPSEERVYSVIESASLRLECNGPVSLPNATFNWVWAARELDDRPRNILLSKRIQIDPTGDLYFSYTTISDADGGVYKCEVFNPFLDLRASGSYSRINVIQHSVEMRPPTILFFTENLTVLEMSTAVLRCFFSGHPEVTIRWQRFDRSPLPFGRFKVENFGSELSIFSVQQTDETDYVCIGRNDVGEEQQILHLSVQATPRFASPSDRPYDVNVTDGQTTLTINCQPYAEPTADVTWYQNGIPLNFSAETNVQPSPDGLLIVIRRVCKNCSDETLGFGSTVVQCKASNVHGSVFANGYINVLDRTRITVAPSDQSFAVGQNVSIVCKADSDPTTPFSHKWYHNASLVAFDDSRVSCDSNGTLHITTAADKDGGMSRVGVYQCRVSNGYSAAEASARLFLIIPVVEQTTASLDLVWLLPLLLLLPLLVICLVGCCYRFRLAGKYNVDETERKNGLDPETELADLDFKVYTRLETSLSKSLASLDMNSQSTLSKSCGADWNNSEYNGSWNFDRWFSEDGSFIGAYKQKV